MVPVLVGLAVGILADQAFSPSPWSWAGVAVFMLGLTLFCVWRRSPGWANWLLAAVLVMPMGALNHAVRYRVKPAHHLTGLRLREDRFYRLEGVVTEGPERRYTSDPFAPDETTGVFWLIRLDLRSLGPEHSRRDVEGGVALFVGSRPDHVRVGDRVTLPVRLRANRAPTNPGEPDSAARYARLGSHATANVTQASSIRVLERAGCYNPGVAVDRLRRRLNGALGRYLPPGADGLVKALLFGRRSALTPLQDRLFKESGTLHFLAISGLHVAVFCAFVSYVLAWMPLDVRPRRLLLLSLIWFYVFFTGLHVSAMRAAWMLSLVLAAPLFGRERDTKSALAGAAAIILVFWPQQLFFAGFQLTFVAVWAMLCVYPELAHVLWPWQDLLGSVQDPAERSLAAETWLYARSYLLLSVTVWAATAPIRVWHFHSLCLIAPLLNLIVWPLVLVLLLLCLGLVLSMLAFGVGAGLVGGLAAYVSRSVERLLTTAGGLPGFGLYVPAPPIWWIALFYIGLVVWVFRAKFRGGRATFVVVVLTLSLSYMWHDAAVRLQRGPRLVLADVGHGQAAVLESAAGSVLMFDAGSSSPSRAEAVAGLLWRDHVDRVDALVVSHMNKDHVSFLPYLHRRFGIETVVTTPPSGVGGLGGRVRDWLGEHVAERRTVAEGGSLRSAGVLCTVLHPDRRFAAGDVCENCRSMVLRCEWEGLSVLFTGDIERDAVLRLCRDYGSRLASDILIVPHHGHFHDALAELVELSDPQVAIVSSSLMGFDLRTAHLLQAHNVPLFVTGRDGAVVVEPAPDGVRVLGWASGRSVRFGPRGQLAYGKGR